MPYPAHPTRVATQLERLSQLVDSGPVALLPIFTTLRQQITLVGQEGAPARARGQQVRMQGNPWIVSRFAAHGHPWVGVQWPQGASRLLTDWLQSAASQSSFATSRPDVPTNQIWVYLGQ